MSERNTAAVTEVLGGGEFEVDYLARVEGETNIRVFRPRTGQSVVELRIFEPPRFFEGFLVGRRFDEVGDITSRICGICPVSHMLTAILAVENAMGVKVSPQTQLLRHVASISQVSASHLVHLYALALPDYVGCQGLADLIETMPGDVQRMLNLRKVLNDLTTLICGGRALHPIGTVVGGFTRIPPAGEFADILERLRACREEVGAVVETFAQLEVPDFAPHRELVALRSRQRGQYAVNDGDIVSSLGVHCLQSEYRKHFQEAQVPYSMAKRASIRGRGSMRVGALSRMSLNRDNLHPRSAELLRQTELEWPNYNPFRNNLAQALELAQGVEECIVCLQGFEPVQEKVQVQVAAGAGGALTEAPRGLLYHSYAINRKGLVEKADLVTPTAHNALAIEQDLKDLVLSLADYPTDVIRHHCEMLVRAYDPCFSCSVH